MYKSADQPSLPGDRREGESTPPEMSGHRLLGGVSSRARERELHELVPGDEVLPSGSVELRSGMWLWTFVRPLDGDALEGVTLSLVDPSDPRRRMEVPGLPSNGLGEADVPYFARRAEVRWVPSGPGEYVIRQVRLPIDLGSPFGSRVGLRIRALTPSGTWREGSLAPGVRMGDLTDEELRVAADRARPASTRGLGAGI